MKIISFDYTKADGKTSKRTLVVSAEPTTLYAGTDISSLDAEDQVCYANEVQLAKDVYLEMLKNINNTYDLNFNYRQFKPDGMKNIVEEEI
jgi:hypothetical protein